MQSNHNRHCGLALLLMLVVVLQVVAPQPVLARGGEDPDDVFVEVFWSGYNVRLTAGGWIGFVAPEPRADLKHAEIDPDQAYQTINALLATGFLWTLDKYPSESENLYRWPDGTVGLGGHGVADGGVVKVRFKAGTTDKRVTIELPATPATKQFMDWVDGFKETAAAALFSD